MIIDRASLQHHPGISEDAYQHQIFDAISSNLNLGGRFISLWAGVENPYTDSRFAHFVPFECARKLIMSKFDVVEVKKITVELTSPTESVHKSKPRIFSQEFLIVSERNRK